MILFFILSASACVRLAGDWINELGSVASFRTFGKTGELSGTYTSAVGKASGVYSLLGTYDAESCEPTLSWMTAGRRRASAPTCFRANKEIRFRAKETPRFH